MENLLKQLEELREKVIKTQKLLDVEGQQSKIRDLKRESEKSDFWSDQKRAIKVGKKLEEMESEVNQWRKLFTEITELEELVAMAQKENDNSLSEDAHKKYKELKKIFENLEFFVLFSGKYDKNNVILSIHAGTGGVDAQDWAEMLLRMYLRFCEKKSWTVNILDETRGQEAGIKSITLHIKGHYAYGFLKSEAGTHRLVRISPFDAEAMRHTSFALVEVLPEILENDKIKIKEEDLKIETFKSSGHGGQGVNTTDSAVRIIHLPTKITVVCRNERSQLQNKETAIKILQARLLANQEQERKEEEKELKGEIKKAKWGAQIRSYVLQPYKMVKDHRTKYETQEVNKVLDGWIDKFIEEYLRYLKK